MSLLDNYLAQPKTAVTFASCVTAFTNGNGGCPFLIVAPMPATLPVNSTAVVNKRYQINSLAQAEALFGKNTAVYRSLSVAFCECKNGKLRFEVILTPTAAGATAAVYKLPVLSATATAHVKFLTVNGIKYPLSIPAGATAAQIAAVIKSVLDAIPDFWFTTVLNGSDLDITANSVGAIGNGLVISVTEQRIAPQVIDGAVDALQVTTAGSGGLDVSGVALAIGSCCYCATSVAATDLVTVMAVQAIIDARLVCGVANCFGVYRWGKKDTVTATAAFGNTGGGSGAPWNGRSVAIWIDPNEAYQAQDVELGRSAKHCCISCDDFTNPVFGDVSRMQCFPSFGDCGSRLSDADFNALWEAGFTPIESIDGYLGVRKERFSSRFDANGRPDESWFSPTTHKFIQVFVALFQSEATRLYGSATIYASGTTINLSNSYGKDVPESLRNRSRYSMNEVRAWFVSFLKSLEGVIFDGGQDWDKIASALTDDQLRGACEGDPRALVFFMQGARVAREGNAIRINMSFTQHTC